MTWEPSPYAIEILRRREEQLKTTLESSLSRRRILLRAASNPKRDTQLHNTSLSIERANEQLAQVWEPPHPATMEWGDALKAIWEAGRKHHDGRNQLLISLHPQTLKTAQRKGVDLRALCILDWHESREVDEALILSSDGELLEHLVVPSKRLGLSDVELEVYLQLRHDGAGVEAATGVARIVAQR